jgi:hypothetical protein
MNRTLSSLLAALAFSAPGGFAQAQLVSFDTTQDLDAYTVASSPSDLLVFGAQAGMGSPAEGGLIVEPVGGGDGELAAFWTQAVDVGGVTEFRTAIAINLADYTDTSGRNRGEIMLGLSRTASVPGEQRKFFDKEENDNFHVKFKFEHEQGNSSRDREMELEVKSVVGNNDAKSNQPELTGSPAFDGWLLLELTGEREAANAFSVTAAIYELGSDGTSAPTLLLETTPQTFTNAPMAAASEWFAGFALRQRSSAASFYLDAHAVDITASVPAAPLALEPEVVTDSIAVLAWEVLELLPAASQFVVELSTAADDFAPDTLFAVNGESGQSAGVTVPAEGDRTQIFENLPAGTDYRFRVFAVNAAGASDPSNVVDFSTASGAVNLPPTIDPVSPPPPLLPEPRSIEISLTGITPGFNEEEQYPDLTVAVAIGDDPDGVIQNVSVIYDNSDPLLRETALLTVHTSGVVGEGSIVVTVDDGQSPAETVTTTILITVSEPTGVIGFENTEALEQGFSITTKGQQLSVDPGLGIGGTGALVVEAAGDGEAALFRALPFDPANATVWQTSVRLNLAELVLPSGKHETEVMLGFSNNDFVPSDPRRIFDKGYGNDNIHVKLKAKHEAGEDDRELEIEILSIIGNNDVKSNKPKTQGNPFDHWIELELVLLPTSTANQFEAFARVLDLGPDGLAAEPTVLLETSTFFFTNAPLAGAELIHPGLALRHRASASALLIDEHRVVLGAIPPASPVALAPVSVGPEVVVTAWQPALALPFASGFRAELAADSGFDPILFSASVADSEATELGVDGLASGTEYVYRIIAYNSGGDSVPSNAISFTTSAAGVNIPPTINPVSTPIPQRPGGPDLVIPLSGITAGFGEDQPLTVTASSDNPAVATPSVDYTSPFETGSLTLQIGEEGEALITVTVSDGIDEVSIQFTLTVSEPPEIIDFENTEALEQGFSITTRSQQLSVDPGLGIGGTGALVVEAAGDGEAALFRTLPFDPANATVWQTSVRLNLAELALGSGKHETEVMLGFSNNNFVPSDPRRIFDKGYGNDNIHVKLKAKHEAGKDDRELEIEILSIIGNNDVKSNKPKSQGNPFDHWIELELVLLPTSTANQFEAFARVLDLGPDGLAAEPTVLLETSTFFFTNAPLAGAELIHPGLALRHRASASALLIDEHRVVLGAIPPASPVALAPVSVGPEVVVTAWQPALALPFASGFRAELAADSGFDPILFSASVADPEATELGLDGLTPGTEYVYRIIAYNSGGDSVPSNAISFTTTAAGVNIPPTINPVATPITQRPGGLDLVIPLSGITAGFGEDQPLTVTASSDNPIVATPSVDYTSPSETGSLTLQIGEEGEALITVTVSDGIDEVSIQFTLTVSEPPEVLSFDVETDLSSELVTDTQGVSLTWSGTAGIGGGGGLVVGASASGEAYGYRAQPYDPSGATIWQSSLRFNFSELLIGTGKNEAELSLGFSASVNAPSELHKFFDKNLNDNIHVKLKAKHEAGKDDRELEIEMKSVVGNNDVKSNSPKSQGNPFANWMELEILLIPMGEGQFQSVARVYDIGPDGTDEPALLLQTSTSLFTNPSLAAANTVYPAFALRNRASGGQLYLDDFGVILEALAPAPPEPVTAAQIHASGFSLSWPVDTTGFVTAYHIEVVADGSPGQFVQPDGTLGAEAYALPNPGASGIAFYGLAADTLYTATVRAANDGLIGDPSEPVEILTLPLGGNAPPTLDPISGGFVLASSAGMQSLALTGISTGGEPDQTLSFSFDSTDPSVIAPSMIYEDVEPVEDNGVLYYEITGNAGTTTVTVTLSDGIDTVARSFEVSVFNPVTLLDFDDAADFSRLLIAEENGSLTVQSGAGIAGSAALRFAPDAEDDDQTAVAFARPANPSSGAGLLATSARLNFGEITAASERSEATVYLGFARDPAFQNGKLKDTLPKSDNPAFGVEIKVSHRPTESGRQRELELRLFSSTGGSDANSNKLELSNVAALDGWVEVDFRAIRAGNDYHLFAEFYSLGLDGTDPRELIAEIGPWVRSNDPIRLASSVYPALQVDVRKEAPESIQLDQWAVSIKPGLPWAPQTLAVTDVSADSASIRWFESDFGPFADGFVIEIVRAADGFASGLFVQSDGSTGGQGIYDDSFTFDPSYAYVLPVNGLLAGTDYRVRVRAANAAGEGAFLNTVTFTTDNAPVLSFAGWQAAAFNSVQQADPTISGPLADASGDGIANIMAYVFGLDPLALNSQSDLFNQSLQDNHLTLSFRCRANLDEASVSAEASSDLVDWTLPVEIVAISAIDQDGFETVTVRVVEAMDDLPRAFIRLLVELTSD